MKEDRELLGQQRPQRKSGSLGRWLMRGFVAAVGIGATLLNGGALAPAAELLYGGVGTAAQIIKGFENL